MDALKTYWFAITNVIVALTVLVFYYVSVAGISAESERASSSIKNSTRAIASGIPLKPNFSWEKALEEHSEKLKQEELFVMDFYRDGDAPLEQFFNTASAGGTVNEVPQISSRLIYKGILNERWEALQEKYVSDQGSEALRIGIEVLKSAQPTWLEEAKSPSESEIREAQKRFWISEKVFNILNLQGLERLDSYSLSAPYVSPEYDLESTPFWIIRDIELGFDISTEKIVALMEAFHDSDFHFRIVGLNQSNVIRQLRSLESNVPFVTFDDKNIVRVSVVVRHYDLVQESENINTEAHGQPGKGPAYSPGKGGKSGRSGRTGRR